MRGLNLTGRGSLSAMFACCVVAFALLVAAPGAFADTNCGAPNSLAGSCFAAGDGNQADGPGDLVDWQSYVPLAALQDGAKGSDSKYKGGSKELEPGGWEFITGNNTPKTDLLNGWGRLDNGFLNVAFTRVKQNGNTYLGFELNQLGAGQFGEASVNLNGLPEGAGRFLTDPCGPNGWFWMHSRASDTVTSEPKDILPGKPIADPSCGLEIDKEVSLSGQSGTFTKTVD